MKYLLKTENLKKYYGKKEVVKALDDVSLAIEEGKSLGLIGESGSGKSTLGRIISCLEKPTFGKISFMDQRIDNLSEKQFRSLRKDMQIIFQSSKGVFDPTYTIGDSIKEVLKNFEKLSEREYEERIDETLKSVGLDPDLKYRNVNQLSGGQCQRANIARALILRPKFVICDEPVSSLDYSIRKQILNLLNEIKEKYGITYLLITHDLSNVSYVCQAVAIMYKGKIVEYLDDTEKIGEKVIHPYSKILYASIPKANPHNRSIVYDKDNERVSELNQIIKGCSFWDRCEKCSEICKKNIPDLKEIYPGHKVACHLV
ncbi:peptide/nickel transport system ATP-binding protein [Acetitomaculum ruminis DSM 5522]|uniref:Peptide/nickel transport system ATP-binding protein n=1 Tax=Acetitomaculum ruminis DSM 5522 TaxID=1120918 RepID=A0A1I0WPP8_9FIRM|nr:ABC transporter ATP-binding protein [Acetitomaculum ruminis]SFA89953.1 peptide/nickel transport system ATP-binding protein [Acetitomaculum ruminis DSM 5522]